MAFINCPNCGETCLSYNNYCPQCGCLLEDDDYDDDYDYDEDNDYDDDDDDDDAYNCDDMLDEYLYKILQSIRLHRQPNLYFSYGRSVPEKVVGDVRRWAEVPEDERIYLAHEEWQTPYVKHRGSYFAVASRGLYSYVRGYNRYYSWSDFRYVELDRDGSCISIDGDEFELPPEDAGGVFKALTLLRRLAETIYG